MARRRFALGAGDRGFLAVVAALAAGLVGYSYVGDYYGLLSVRDGMILGLFALSLDYLWGKTGFLTFGHSAFFGIGAYGLAIVSRHIEAWWGTYAGLLVGILAAGLVALVVGYFLIFGRVRGAYLTIVTLAVTIIVHQVALSWSEVTGGDQGLVGIQPPSIVLGGWSYALVDPQDQYLAVLVIAFACLLGLWLALRGRYGRVLEAIQDNEARAESLGHNTSLHLLVAFVVSCMLAALAGTLFAVMVGYVAPDLVGLLWSTVVVIWVAIGGRGTLIGPFIGAFVVFRLQQEVSSINPTLWPLCIGAFFVVMVFVLPDGALTIVRAIGSLRARLAGRGRAL